MNIFGTGIQLNIPRLQALLLTKPQQLRLGFYVLVWSRKKIEKRAWHRKKKWTIACSPRKRQKLRYWLLGPALMTSWPDAFNTFLSITENLSKHLKIRYSPSLWRIVNWKSMYVIPKLSPFRPSIGAIGSQLGIEQREKGTGRTNKKYSQLRQHSGGKSGDLAEIRRHTKREDVVGSSIYTLQTWVSPIYKNSWKTKIARRCG